MHCGDWTPIDSYDPRHFNFELVYIFYRSVGETIHIKCVMGNRIYEFKTPISTPISTFMTSITINQGYGSVSCLAFHINHFQMLKSTILLYSRPFHIITLTFFKSLIYENGGVQLWKWNGN